MRVYGCQDACLWTSTPSRSINAQNKTKQKQKKQKQKQNKTKRTCLEFVESQAFSVWLSFFTINRAPYETFKNAAIFSRFIMVPRPLAAARAMRSCTCADVIQPCCAWDINKPKRKGVGLGQDKNCVEFATALALRERKASALEEK